MHRTCAPKKIRRTWRAFLIAIVGLTVGYGATDAGLAQDTIDDLKQNGAVIAIANEPPWMRLDTSGQPVGIGPDVDKAILEAMGITKVSGQVMEYGAMIPSLQAKRATLSSSGGLYITPERCKSVIFSDPVGCNGEGFILSVDLVEKVKSYKDVADLGLRIGVCGGCFEQKLAAEAGVAADKIVIFPDGTSGFKLLTDKRIDVFAHDSATAFDLQKRLGDPKATAMIRVANTKMSCAGAAFNKENVALRDAYNEGLKTITANGKLLEILAKYDQKEILTGRDTVTTEKLCTP